MNSGIIVAILWILLQTALWVACTAATLFLTAVLIALLAAPFNPSTWSTP